MLSCNSSKEEAHRIGERVDSFAIYYFNWQYEEATKYCTQSSKKWLEFAASQVNEEDLKILRTPKEELTTEIISIDYNNSEQNAMVRLCVKNFIESQSFNEVPIKKDKAIFNLHLIKEKSEWKIKMEALPQSEKLNPD